MPVLGKKVRFTWDGALIGVGLMFFLLRMLTDMGTAGSLIASLPMALMAFEES